MKTPSMRNRAWQVPFIASFKRLFVATWIKVTRQLNFYRALASRFGMRLRRGDQKGGLVLAASLSLPKFLPRR